MRRELMGLYGEHRGEVVLDYGCGCGDDMVGFMVFSQARKIIGCDISRKALDTARMRLDLHAGAASRAELVVTTDEHTRLPLAENSVDYIHCSGVLHHVSRPLLVLGEFHRILRPDGSGCVMVYGKDSVWRHLYTAYELRILERDHQDLDLDDSFAMTVASADCPVTRSYEPEEFITLCKSAGLEAEFVGGYFAARELDVVKRLARPAVGDERLAGGHRQFAKELRFDKRGLPLFKGYYAGVGAVFRLRKT